MNVVREGGLLRLPATRQRHMQPDRTRHNQAPEKSRPRESHRPSSIWIQQMSRCHHGLVLSTVFGQLHHPTHQTPDQTPSTPSRLIALTLSILSPRYTPGPAGPDTRPRNTTQIPRIARCSALKGCANHWTLTTSTLGTHESHHPSIPVPSPLISPMPHARTGSPILPSVPSVPSHSR